MWPFIARQIGRRPPPTTTWLDLCCGAGSLLELLGPRGYPCVGVDVSPHQLALARQVAPGAELVCQDIRRLALGRRFDVITCLFDSLNYVRRRAALRGVLHRIRRHLAPGGVFICDVNTTRVLREKWPGESIINDPDRVICVIGSYRARTRTGHCRFIGFVRHGQTWRRFDEEHVEVGLDRTTFEPLLADAGLRFRRYDGLRFTPIGARPLRIAYVCRAAE